MKGKNKKTKSTPADRMVHVRLDEDLHRRLRVLVASRDQSIQQWLSELIAREVARQSSTSVQQEKEEQSS